MFCIRMIYMYIFAALLTGETHKKLRNMKAINSMINLKALLISSLTIEAERTFGGVNNATVASRGWKDMTSIRVNYLVHGKTFKN